MRPRRPQLVLWTLLLIAASGCPESEPPARARKVAIIGWDAASWSVIDPLLREGRLPNLQRLLDRGARGELVADPPMFSPVLWTTLATGFPRDAHGIRDFQLLEPGGNELMLASTMHRKRAPLWRIVSSQGRSTGFTGWWTTWPAEPVQGWMISDHLAYNRWDAWARRPEGENYHLTSPPGLALALAPHAVRPEQIETATLTALVPFNAQEQRELEAAQKPVKFHAPSVYKFGYATDASNAAFAGFMLDNGSQPDLFGLVFILSDVAGHVFWHHYQPEVYPPQEEPGRLRDAIPNTYEQLDRWTGEILDRLEPETLVLLISDHGMGASRQLPRPGINPAGDHLREGIFVASGNGVVVGTDLGRIPALNFAPTVLALMGLPLAADMPGSPVTVGLPVGTTDTIPTYGDGRLDFMADGIPPSTQDYEERLRSLGYVE